MRKMTRDLLFAIPAVLMFVGIVAVGIVGRDSEALADRYLVRARIAQLAEKDAWAILCFRKAEQLGTGDPQVTYDKALAQAKTRPAEAAETMRSIAEGPDAFPLARIWLVRDKLQKGRVKSDDLKAVEAELDKVIAETSPSPKALNIKLQAMQLAALVKIQTKGPEAAIFYLKELSKYSVVERLRLAKVYELTGNPKGAAEEANLVLQSALDVVRSKPEDTDARLLGVDACYVLKDFRQAVNLLGDGIRNQGQDPRLMNALSTTYLVWSEDESKAAQPKLDNVLELLLLSTRFPPVNRHVYERLASFARKPGEGGETARKALISSLARGQSPSLVHLLLGTVAYDSKNTEQAMRHWQLAADVDPKCYITMSNLAIGLLEIGEPDTALALINKALEHGDEPQMHDTRGRVLARQGKYPEALADIEIAMAGLPDNWFLRRQAAELHQRLNQPEQATKYLNESEKIRAAATAAKKEPAEGDEKQIVPPPPIVAPEKGGTTTKKAGGKK
jgi:tetratricopeptide (TPR) repeat protein